MRATKVVSLALLGVFLAAGSGWAQLPTGSVVGTVYDRTGAVLPGAQITLRDAGTGSTRSTTSSSVGFYEFPQLRPGAYEITAEAKGFRRLVEHNVVVNAGLVARADLTLELGDVAQTVEVRAELQLLQSDTPSISKAVDPLAIKNLPLVGRQFLDLALTVPGTVPTAPGTQVDSFSVAGMRSQSNNYTLDGVSNNDPQVNGPLNAFRLADAVQEFNVQTSIASTEVGRNSGAQVSIITKSGGNDFHGSLFYYIRNDALDATPFFLNRAGQPKNPLRRNQFGGTAGGPIARNKAFWFFSFEGWREKVQEPQTSRVPTLVERAQVSDPVSKKLLQFWPEPNTPLTGGRNWTGTVPRKNDNETFFWRGDVNLTDNHRLMSRYAWFRGRTLNRQNESAPFNGSITNQPGQHSFLLQETYATARWVNELRLGFSRNHTFFQPADVQLDPAEIFTDASGKPLPGYVDTRVDPLNGGLPRITVTGLTSGGLGAGTNMPQGRSTNTYEVIENLTWSAPRGWDRHTLRFGAHMRREIANRFLNGNYRGNISFPSWTRFASGQPQRGTLRTGLGDQTFRTWFRRPWYFYAQDTFKPRPNLTLNYGLRWEYPGQSIEKYDRGSNFVPGVGAMMLNSNQRIDISPTALGRAAVVLTSVNVKLPRSGQFDGDYNNFAPFLGIAYTPKFGRGFFGDGKTVIRTGFRLSYDDIFANIPVNMGLNFPVLTTTLATSTYTWATVLNQNRTLFSADQTVPGGERGSLSFNAWDTEAPTAYAMNYALEIERQFGRDFALELSYVGSQGRKLGVFVDPNQPVVTVKDPTRRGDQAPNVRIFPFPQYAGMSLGAFVSNSSYNGMVITLRKRPSHGLSFNGSYTLGKSLDENSSFFGSDADAGAYADTRNRKLDHGRSDFDVRQRVVVSAIWELPIGPGRPWLRNTHGFVGQVVGGWNLSAITQYRTGFPFSVHTGHSTDLSGLNQFADRPNWKPSVTKLPTNMSDPDKAFDKSVFLEPRAGDVGNAPRNAFTGPSFQQWNIAVLKNFRVGEGRLIQFRAEALNAFNHTNFKLPEHNLDSSGAGAIGNTEDPRLIQLGLRFEW